MDNKRLDKILVLTITESKKHKKEEEENKYIKQLKRENTNLKKEIQRLNKKIERLQSLESKTAKIRQSKEYKEFRKRILKRDNYQCVMCGEIENLQVHHIKPVKDFPELIMEENNAQTLCLICHTKTDSYLRK